MSRSLINLRRALLGVSCVVVFGFGATQAFADTDPGVDIGFCPNPPPPGFPRLPYYRDECNNECRNYGFDYGNCTVDDRCMCYYWA